jgi:hypothetical protein
LAAARIEWHNERTPGTFREMIHGLRGFSQNELLPVAFNLGKSAKIADVRL